MVKGHGSKTAVNGARPRRRAHPANSDFAHKNKGMGLFESVQVSMDAVEDKAGSLDQTDVTVTVKEKNWYLLQSGATTAGTQGNLDASEFSNLRYVRHICIRGRTETKVRCDIFARVGSETATPPPGGGEGVVFRVAMWRCPLARFEICH